MLKLRVGERVAFGCFDLRRKHLFFVGRLS